MIGNERKTVAKYWNKFSKKMDMLDKTDIDVKMAYEKIASASAYDSSRRTRRKYTKELDEYIDLILNNKRLKDSTLGVRKQKLTNMQILQIYRGFKIMKGESYHK